MSSFVTIILRPNGVFLSVVHGCARVKAGAVRHRLRRLRHARRSSRAAPPRFNAARGSGGRKGRPHTARAPGESIGVPLLARILAPILSPFDWYSAIQIGIAAT